MVFVASLFWSQKIDVREKPSWILWKDDREDLIHYINSVLNSWEPIWKLAVLKVSFCLAHCWRWLPVQAAFLPAQEARVNRKLPCTCWIIFVNCSHDFFQLQVLVVSNAREGGIQTFISPPCLCSCKDLVDLLLYSKGCLNTRKMKHVQRCAVHHSDTVLYKGLCSYLMVIYYLVSVGRLHVALSLEG